VLILGCFRKTQGSCRGEGETDSLPHSHPLSLAFLRPYVISPLLSLFHQRQQQPTVIQGQKMLGRREKEKKWEKEKVRARARAHGTFCAPLSCRQVERARARASEYVTKSTRIRIKGERECFPSFSLSLLLSSHISSHTHSQWFVVASKQALVVVVDVVVVVRKCWWIISLSLRSLARK